MLERVTFAADGAEQVTPTYTVGVDGSGPGTAALKWTLRRAEHYAAKVQMVHVVDADSPAKSTDDPDQDTEEMGNRILSDARRLAEKSFPDVDVATLLIVGHVAEDLVRLAMHSDLLVIGTHKTGYLRGRAIGSRSIRIASLAHCSVAIVPDVSLISRRGVAVGIDIRTGSPVALRSGANEAHRLKQCLVLLATDRPNQAESRSGASGRPALRSVALSGAVSAATAIAPDLEVHSRFSMRVTAEALLDASRDACLLVIGAAPTHGLMPSIVGPVTHDVLMNINAPVLIARATEVL